MKGCRLKTKRLFVLVKKYMTPIAGVVLFECDFDIVLGKTQRRFPGNGAYHEGIGNSAPPSDCAFHILTI